MTWALWMLAAVVGLYLVAGIVMSVLATRDPSSSAKDRIMVAVLWPFIFYGLTV